MELGGNIELFGVDEFSDNDLIVIKKIVGHFTKHFTETYPSFEGLRVTFDYENGEHVLIADIQLDEEVKQSTCSHKNMYFAIDAVLKSLDEKAEA
jgi:ribosome-associated translation inhibitor RaiA